MRIAASRSRYFFIYQMLALIFAFMNQGCNTDTTAVSNSSNVSDTSAVSDTYADLTAPVRKARHVSPSEKLSLQVLLDEYGYIVLQTNGDYQSEGLPELTISSGQRIEGGYGTLVPRILIPAGVSNTTIDGVISGVWPNNAIEFTGVLPAESTNTDATNYNITIIGGSNGPGGTSYIKVLSGARIERLQATFMDGIDASLDTGYIRNSVFRSVLARGRNDIQIKLHGNEIMPSYGNSIVGYSSVSGPGAANISRFGDLYLVGADAEAWYCFTNGTTPRQQRAFVFSDMDALRIIGLSGGTPSSGCPSTPGAMLEVSNTPTLAVWFDRSQSIGVDDYMQYIDGVSTYVATQSNLDSSTTRLFTNNPTDQLRTEVMPRVAGSQPGVTYINNQNITSSIPDDWKNRLLDAHLGSAKATAPVKPARRTVDPLGQYWNADFETKPDSSTAIQQLIDLNQIAILPAGTYYLDRPLRIGNTTRVEGIVGESKDSVFLISKGAFPVIQGRGNIVGGKGVEIVLEGLSIYGGTYGLDISSEAGNLGLGAQVKWSSFRNLRFSRQSVAGVNFDHIYGVDANVWYKVDFSNMPIAFKGIGVGIGDGMNYADKQTFIDTQYHNISDVVWNWESTRPSGNNIWVDAYFFNVGEVSRTRGASGMMWVNSVFHDVAGPVALNIVDSGDTSTDFFTQVDCLWTGYGPTVVTDTFSGKIGALFIDTEFNQEGGTLVASAGLQTLLAWNSKITGTAGVGNVTYGAFVNSTLGQFDKLLSYVDNGVTTDVADTQATPYRQVMAR